MDVPFSSTIELAAAICSGGVSSTEVLEAQLRQIERHNPALNAVVILDTEAARERAGAADAATRRGERWGPLHGVPFTLKDTHSTAGMRSTVGFPPFAGHVARMDSPVVARLREAGGILVGKTNAAMLLADYQTDNPLFGTTNNPWDLGRTPGGSSGGAAAALAAGMTPFEIGTDMAGSIRIPAHFCGVFGLKPTEHRVSLEGGFPNPGDAPRSIRSMNCIGPMARSAEDLALLYSIIAGPDGADTDVAPVPVDAVPALEVKGLRIAYAADFSRHSGGRRDTRCRRAPGADAGPRRGGWSKRPCCPSSTSPPNWQSAGELIGMMVGAAQPEGAGEAVAGALFRGAAAARPVDRRLGEIPGGLGRAALPGIDDHRVRAPQARHADRGRRKRGRLLHGLSPFDTVQLQRPSRARAALRRQAKACRSACSWSAGAGRSRGCWRSRRR